jgi:hypothetical protein
METTSIAIFKPLPEPPLNRHDRRKKSSEDRRAPKPLKNRKPVTYWFTMAEFPNGEIRRVGNKYLTKKHAADWLPFVQGYYRACRCFLDSCTILFSGDEPTEKSIAELENKVNLNVITNRKGNE